MRNLARVNLKPRADTSKRRVDILVTHQAFIKIITLEKRTPFFRSTAVKGKAAYMGPAAKEPRSRARKIPLNPELSPIYFIKISLGIHTSIRHKRSIIGGRTESIWRKLDLALVIALAPISLLKMNMSMRHKSEIKKNIYLFRILKIRFITKVLPFWWIVLQ